MKKADFEFVAFDTEDVITTSGAGSVHDVTPHLYLSGVAPFEGIGYKPGPGSFMLKGKGMEKQYDDDGFYPSEAFPEGTPSAGWYIMKEDGNLYRCGEDHSGW